MVMQHQQVANRVDLVKERLSFLVQYLRNPKEVGALLPSGSPLANIMTRERDFFWPWAGSGAGPRHRLVSTGRSSLAKSSRKT